MDNKIIFCTYFDKGYLPKGLALYYSLIRNNPKVQLWILPMDAYTRKILHKMDLKNLHLIDKKDFEDEYLLAAKRNRSKVEYMWTCTPSLPLYIIKRDKRAEEIIYVDADLYFYSSVSPARIELGNKSIYTVEHRYPPDQKYRELTSGRFNVAFQIFTRKAESIKCLKRWRRQCLDWCYWKEEDGKMGDQMYLNEWPNLYKSLVISGNLGVDAAPWNINQYKVTNENGVVYIDKDKLMCYHFHQFRILGESSFDYAYGYNLPRNVCSYIYEPYVKELRNIINSLKILDPTFKIDKPDIKFEQRIKGFVAKVIGNVYWRLRNSIWQLNQKN